MNDTGRLRRWRRFIDPQSAKALIVPIDHGLTLGPIDGLDDLAAMRAWLRSGALTGVVMHKGMVERLDGAQDLGLMVHLNGAVAADASLQAMAPPLKVRLSSIEAALALGADAVSVHLDMGGPSAPHYLQLLGEVVDEAHRVGLPVMAMLYDKSPGATSPDLARQRHFMRAAVEVGADVLKVQPPAELSRLPELLQGVAARTPVLVAGGALKSELELLSLARAVVSHGAAGLCVGRNVFQRADPAASLREVLRVLRGQERAEEPRPMAPACAVEMAL